MCLTHDPCAQLVLQILDFFPLHFALDKKNNNTKKKCVILCHIPNGFLIESAMPASLLAYLLFSLLFLTVELWRRPSLEVDLTPRLTLFFTIALL
jgi:hypothetical protein